MKSIFWTLYTSLFFLSAYQSYSQNFYLAKDGITCMCPDAVIGDSGDPGNGIIYTKRSRAEITETNIASTCFSEISDTFYSDSNFYQDVANNNSNDFPTNTTVARTIKSEDNPRLETILPVAYISMPAQPWNRQSNIIALDEVYSNQWEHYYYTTSGVAAEIFVPDRLVVFLEGGEFDALYMRDFIVINYPFIEPWVSAGGKLIISAASNISGPNWGAFGVFSYQDTRSPFGFVVDINDPFFTESPYSPIFPSSGPYYGNDISHNYLTGPDLNPLIIDNRQRITLAEKSVGSGIVRFSGLVTPWLIDNPNNGLWGPDPQLENLLYRIVYFDIINPTAVCQDFTVALDATGNATITAADIDNGSSDNESVASLSLDTTTFTCADLGENTVTLTVTDTSGNQSTCTATVTVVDNIDPTAVCQDITIQLDATGNTSIVAADIDNGSSDNCSVSLSADVTSFTAADLGANTVTLTVTDSSGNTVVCTAIVTVEDNINPTAVCQDFTVALDATGNATITAADIDNGSSDNESVASLSLDTTTFNCADLGENTVNLTVTDTSGNESTCSATVTVVDNIDPTAVGQDITVQLDAAGNATITTGDIDNGSSDNCGAPTLGLDVTSFGCGDLGANAVLYIVEDSSGNQDGVTITVTVVDNIAPTVVTQNITVELDATGNATITTADLENGTSDNCTLASLTLDVSSFSCADLGANTVTLTAEDQSGNTNFATATVTVVDDLVPTVLTQAITVNLDAMGMATITPADIDNGSSDNCTIDTYSLDIDSFSCADVGPNTVTLTVVDLSGNSAQATAVVTVVNPTPTSAPLSGGDQSECALSPLQTLTATANVNAGETLVWYDAPTGGNVVADPSLNALGSITYFAEAVNDLSSCVSLSRTAITLEILALPTPMITNNTGISLLDCNLTAISLTASGGDSYLWSTGETTAIINVTTPDTYSVTVTGANGCSDVTSVVITQDIALPIPVITNNTGATELTCNLTSINLTASGGESYLWSTGETTATIEVTTPDTYSVNVTGPNGCTDTTALVITQDITLPVPVITSNTGVTQLDCNFPSISLTASGGDSYLWSTGETTATIDVTSPDTYSVTVTGTNGCEDTTALVITEDVSLPIPLITNNTGTTELNCAVTTINLTASGGTSYLWSTGATTASIDVTTPDTYSVTVKGANGCEDSTDVIITQDLSLPIPVITNNSGTTELNCNVTVISLTASGGASYLWSNGATTASINVTSPDTYSVTVTGVNGCSDETALNITQDITQTDPPISAGDQSECELFPVQTLTASATVGASETLVWYDAATGGNVVADPTLSAVGSVTYYATAVDDLNGCESIFREPVTLEIIDAPSAPVSGGDITEVAQDPVQTITATATVNAGDLLTWFDTAVGGNVITDPSLNTPGTVTYYAESFDPTVGCDSPVRTAVTLTLTATCNDGIRNGDETGIDCGGSSCLECAPETILHEGYFETGWDGWIDGGVDCERVFGPEAYEGDYSIRLRADTGLEASMILENIDIDAFNWVIVDFYFYTKNLSHGERFILEYTDDLFYYTVAEFVKGEDFDNEQFYNKSVLMLRYNNEFSQHASWRFRAITNSQNDQVFIDQVTITGNPEAVFLSGASEVFMPPYLSLAPNPARDYISIKTSLEGNLDYTIYNFLGQVIHKGPYNGIEIPVYDLSTGLYFLEISNGDQKSHRKFVKE